MIYRLVNSLKDYAWGSRDFIQSLTGLLYWMDTPLAEMWMGAHPSSPSRIVTPNGDVPLDIYLNTINAQGLPFLFKLLAADQPLSLQAHPSLERARDGFARENSAGIELSDPRRNYKDDNHKPEMLLALTPFDILCGIRPYAAICNDAKLLDLGAWLPAIDDFYRDQTPGSLSDVFRQLLDLQTDHRKELITTAFTAMDSLREFPPDLRHACDLLRRFFPDDIGCIFPVFLNFLRLSPGEAIFLDAGVPHSYLKGAGLEIMTNSDNVLRGALTPKHVDVEEFLQVCAFAPLPSPQVKPVTTAKGWLLYTPPGDEFELATASNPDTELGPCAHPRVVLCLESEIILTDSESDETIRLSRGESAIIISPAKVRIKGPGRVVMAGAGNCSTPVSGRR